MINLSAVITSPIGKKIGIHIQNDKLHRLSFEPEDAPSIAAQDPISQKVADELSSYFKNPKHRFNLDFDLNGTSFQRKVWKALQSIPSGKTLSYGALAESLQTGPRAVGEACRGGPSARPRRKSAPP